MVPPVQFLICLTDCQRTTLHFPRVDYLHKPKKREVVLPTGSCAEPLLPSYLSPEWGEVEVVRSDPDPSVAPGEDGIRGGMMDRMHTSLRPKSLCQTGKVKKKNSTPLHMSCILNGSSGKKFTR